LRSSKYKTKKENDNEISKVSPEVRQAIVRFGKEILVGGLPWLFVNRVVFVSELHLVSRGYLKIYWMKIL